VGDCRPADSSLARRAVPRLRTKQDRAPGAHERHGVQVRRAPLCVARPPQAPPRASQAAARQVSKRARGPPRLVAQVVMECTVGWTQLVAKTKRRNEHTPVSRRLLLQLASADLPAPPPRFQRPPQAGGGRDGGSGGGARRRRWRRQRAAQHGVWAQRRPGGCCCGRTRVRTRADDNATLLEPSGEVPLPTAHERAAYRTAVTHVMVPPSSLGGTTQPFLLLYRVIRRPPTCSLTQGREIREQLANGTYRTGVDTATKACARALPWWQQFHWQWQAQAQAQRLESSLGLGGTFNPKA
jgi:hypothetical protein